MSDELVLQQGEIPDIKFENMPEKQGQDYIVIEEELTKKPDVNVDSILKENEELRRRADSAEALRKGVEQLGEKLGGYQNRPVQQQTPIEDNSAYIQDFNEKVFSDNPYKHIDSLVEKKLKSYNSVDPNALLYIAKNQMKLDPEKRETFIKYEKEIENVLGSLNAEQKKNPMAVEWAYGEVKKMHEKEIVEDLVAKRVAEEMKKYQQPDSQRQTQFVERGRTSPPVDSKPNTLTMNKDQMSKLNKQVNGIYEYEIRGVSREYYAQMIKEGRV